MGIEGTPQQADLAKIPLGNLMQAGQGVYHLALLATILIFCKRIYYEDEINGFSVCLRIMYHFYCRK